MLTLLGLHHRAEDLRETGAGMYRRRGCLRLSAETGEAEAQLEGMSTDDEVTTAAPWMPTGTREGRWP